jgi:hypothetical protein
MKVTINIDLSNNKALALFNYIKTLDFINVEENDTLSTQEKKAIDKAIKEIELGKGIPHNKAMEQTKKKFPKLFK